MWGPAVPCTGDLFGIASCFSHATVAGPHEAISSFAVNGDRRYMYFYIYGRGPASGRSECVGEETAERRIVLRMRKLTSGALRYNRVEARRDFRCQARLVLRTIRTQSKDHPGDIPIPEVCTHDGISMLYSHGATFRWRAPRATEMRSNGRFALKKCAWEARERRQD